MVTYIKDIDLIILSELNDKDLISMCRTCKYIENLCKNDTLWKKVFFKKYAPIEKCGEKSWKELYISLTKYLRLKSTTNYDSDIHMIEAIKDNNIDIIKYFISIGYKDFEMYIGNAAIYGSIEIIKYLLSLRKSNDTLIEWCMCIAAKVGREDIVHMFINLYKKENIALWNGGLWAAGKGSHIELMKFFISKGANNMEEGLWRAAKSNQLKAIKFYIEHGATNMDIGLINSAGVGNLELVKFFIDQGATDFEGAKYQAKMYGKHEIINYLNRLTFIQ